MNTVRYIDLGHCVIGQPAMVIPLDHPGPGVTNRIWARTSPVRAINRLPNGDIEFWTMNSHYIPADIGLPVRHPARYEVAE